MLPPAYAVIYMHMGSTFRAVPSSLTAAAAAGEDPVGRPFWDCILDRVRESHAWVPAPTGSVTGCTGRLDMCCGALAELALVCMVCSRTPSLCVRSSCCSCHAALGASLDVLGSGTAVGPFSSHMQANMRGAELHTCWHEGDGDNLPSLQGARPWAGR